MNKARISLWLVTLVAQCTASVEYPAVLEMDLVFPRQEKTYAVNDSTQLPIVFAVQGAEAYFDWGASFSWRLSLLGTVIGPQIVAINSAIPNDGEIPPDVIDDVWWVSSQTPNTTELAAGDYMLDWALTVSSCYRRGNTLYLGKEVSAGSGMVNFTLADDGSGSEISLIDDDDPCPSYLGRTAADVAREEDTCPDFDLGGDDILRDSEPSPCNAKLSVDMANCIVANLTGSAGDVSCDRVKVRPDEEGEVGGGDGKGEDADEREGEETTGREEDDADYALCITPNIVLAFTLAVGVTHHLLS